MQETSSTEQLCNQADMHGYLASKQYKIHPCTEFNALYEVHKNCLLFVSNLPPAIEVS